MAFGVERGGASSRIGAGLVLMTLVFTAVGAGTSAASAQAEDCPNEQLRGQEGTALRLPDCRAYEQVSPVAKNFADALGEAEVVQSSPSGGGVTFFSDAPFPGVLSATGSSLYLSTRAGGEWSTQGLVPQTGHPLPTATGRGIRAELDRRPLRGDRQRGTRSRSGSAARSLLVSPRQRDRYLPAARSGHRDVRRRHGGRLAHHLRIKRTAPARSRPNVVNLYEWDNSKPPGKQLSLAGLLPEGEAPTGGSVAGPGGPALGGRAGGATGRFYTQDTISADGSRIFFSDAGSGRIYMREPAAARTIPVSAGTQPAYLAGRDDRWLDGLLHRRRRSLPIRCRP